MAKWKLVQNIDHKMTSTEFNNQLFDLEADPYEKNDLTEDHPAVVKKLNKKINEWRSLHPIGGSYVKINLASRLACAKRLRGRYYSCKKN